MFAIIICFCTTFSDKLFLFYLIAKSFSEIIQAKIFCTKILVLNWKQHICTIRICCRKHGWILSLRVKNSPLRNCKTCLKCSGWLIIILFSRYFNLNNKNNNTKYMKYHKIRLNKKCFTISRIDLLNEKKSFFFFFFYIKVSENNYTLTLI